MRRAAHPGLYDIESSPPALLGSRCGACGTAFFPPIWLGCPACGAPEPDLATARLAARGHLQAFATVHHHRGRDIEAPFTVGEVELDDGPVIRATMVDPTGDGLLPGQAVRAVWATTGADGDDEIVEPRFDVVR